MEKERERRREEGVERGMRCKSCIYKSRCNGWRQMQSMGREKRKRKCVRNLVQ